MTEKAKRPPNPVRLAATDAEDVFVALRPTQRFRFLLSDGRTVDVLADRDDSDLRAAVLDETKVERIEGVTRLPFEEDEDP